MPVSSSWSGFWALRARGKICRLSVPVLGLRQMSSNDGKPSFEEVKPDGDDTMIISSGQDDLLADPAKPIRPSSAPTPPPPAPPVSGPPPEFPEAKSSLPDPAPVPKVEAKAPGGSKLRLTKKRSGSKPTPKPAAPPVDEFASDKPEAPKFSSPPKIPASQRQPAYDKSPFDQDDDQPPAGNGGMATALAIGSMLLAVGALLVALGILSIAPSKEVTSSQIAPGAVGEKQIYDGSIGANKLQPQLIEDLQGQQGETGPRGSRGPRGARGVRGPAGLTGLELVRRSVNGTAASEVSSVALCKAGQVAVGGGGSITGATGAVALTASEPNASLDGWRVSAAQVGETRAGWSLSVYAICAEPSSELLRNIR
jgi:hypothetical protein